MGQVRFSIRGERCFISERRSRAWPLFLDLGAYRSTDRFVRSDSVTAMPMRVVSVARLEAIGLGNPAILNAKKSGGVDPATEPTDPQHPRNSKDFRLGFARLSVYFHVAAPAFFGPGMQTEENITHLKDKIKPDLAPLPHWCGIFALWAHKAAGTAGIGTWVVSAGISSVTGFKTVGQGAPLLPADA